MCTDYSIVNKRLPEKIILKELKTVKSAFEEFLVQIEKMGKYDLESSDNIQAIEKCKSDISRSISQLLNSYSWTLATSTDESVRNGDEAVKLATQAVQLAEESNKPGYMDTLAAAYAETGDFTKAVETMKQAIELCKDEELLETLNNNLKTLESGQPIREEEKKNEEL